MPRDIENRLLLRIEASRNNLPTRSTRPNTPRLNQKLKGLQRAIRQSGLLQDRSHLIRVKERVGRGLRCRHIQSLNDEDMPFSIEAGKIIDRAVSKISRVCRTF